MMMCIGPVRGLGNGVIESKRSCDYPISRLSHPIHNSNSDASAAAQGSAEVPLSLATQPVGPCPAQCRRAASQKPTKPADAGALPAECEEGVPGGLALATAVHALRASAG